MIIIYIAGGLGDQMSRYALGRYLSLKHKVELFLDTSFYTSKHNYAESDTRVFALNHFQISAPLATQAQLKKLATNPYLRRLGFIKSSHILTGLDDANLANFVCDRDYYLEARCGTSKHWSQIRSVLLTDFALKEPLVLAPELAKFLSSGTIVALHCRRGDKANNPQVNKLHGVCSADYYQRALAELEERLGSFNLLVFSDDPDWVKANLHFSCPVKFAADYYQAGHEYEELILMSQCHHQIISNSSFSWWAAWLNANPDKLVIAPTIFMKEADVGSKGDVPGDWIRL